MEQELKRLRLKTNQQMQMRAPTYSPAAILKVIEDVKVKVQDILKSSEQRATAI